MRWKTRTCFGSAAIVLAVLLLIVAGVVLAGCKEKATGTTAAPTESTAAPSG
jgi:uncharacterized lipoprotein YajG